MIAASINHLWQSTAFALAAAGLAMFFLNSRARVRFWIWFSASIKFFMPFSLLLMLGSRVAPEHEQPRISGPSVSTAILLVTEPFPQQSLIAPQAAPVKRDWTAEIILGIWACGFLAVAIVRLRSYLRIREAMKASCQADLGLPVEARYCRSSFEPAVFGVWKPVLLLPIDVTERLTPSQFQAILAHELCHVRRRDNLTASIHMLVEAIFWFHPLVWWIGSRLVAERERGCDEEVLSLGNQSHDYAEGILNVCKAYFESPLRSFSGVSGSDLKKRIRDILGGRVAGELTLGRKAVLALVAILAVSTPLIVGVIDAPLIRAQSAVRPQFEVASIKRCANEPALPPGGRGGGFPSFSPGRMTLNCQTVMGWINAAYITYADGRKPDLLTLHRIPIEGGPGWITSERYTINAKAENNANPYVMQGPLLQTLLESRFKLRIHRETREIPVYNLVVAKGGPKLKPFQKGSCTPMPPIDPTNPATLPPFPALPAGQRYCKMSGGASGPNFAADAQGISVEDFARGFLSAGDRPVVDKTGIKGLFEFHLEFGLEDASRQRMTEITGVDPGEPTEPSVFIAIQEKLGLKLEPAKGKGEFLVIDHVKRPDEN